MCGIAGAIYKYKFYDTIFDYSIIEKMLAHQHMRGPDCKFYVKHENAVIGHNRLSIMDTSVNGNQPMQTDRWILSYNGEIYNYQKLRHNISPRAWKSYNDTETLLFLLDEKGIDTTLKYIDGMFAFAAYDKIDRKLYLAVDFMGIKPLYYYMSDFAFAFASSPAALTHLKSQWEFNKDSLIDYLALGATYQPLFTGMKKVMPGHLVVYDEETKTVCTSQWYEPAVHNVSANDVMEAVKDSIQSVKLADVPIHIFLSGGIDSTVVASQCQFFKAEHLASPEEKYAKEVAKRFENPFHVIKPTDFHAYDCLKDYAKQSGDVSAASIIPYIVSKEVSKFAKVAISANGADELFFGYNRITSEVTPAQFYHIFRQAFILKDSLNDDLGGALNPYCCWGSYYDYKDSRQLELQTYVPFDLNKTLDFAAMCHGLEVRVPFLNKSVVEMALSLPFEQHCNNKLGRKAILKNFLLTKGFKNDFINRPKLGFSLHTEPSDYDELKENGCNFLKKEFNIDPQYINGRDAEYYKASAAAFYVWWKVWEHKLISI